MIKKLTSLLAAFSILLVFLVPQTVVAVDVFQPTCSGGEFSHSDSTLCKSNENQPSTGNKIYGQNGVLTRVAKLMAVIVGIASVIMIIIGGFKYVTSSGDPSNVKSAKDTIIYALVGILIAVSTQSIVVFVLSKL